MTLLDIVSIITHPIYYFKDKTKVILSSFHGQKRNEIKSDSALVKKSDIRFAGKGNTLEISGCHLYNCNIFLRGEGHSLIVDKGVKLFNVRIKIIGKGNTIHIKKNTTIGGGNIICGGIGIPINIGENCVIAEGVDIWSTDTHSVYQNEALVNAPRPIQIGNHVWMGKDVAILKGVSIGDNAVIGMRSVVTHDIEEGSLNAGSPARKIKDSVTWSMWNPNNKE